MQWQYLAAAHASMAAFASCMVPGTMPVVAVAVAVAVVVAVTFHPPYDAVLLLFLMPGNRSSNSAVEAW